MPAFGKIGKVETLCKSQPIILDQQHQRPRGGMLNSNSDRGGLSVTPHVIQSFLDNAEDGELYRLRQPSKLRIHAQGDFYSGSFSPLMRERLYGSSQAKAVYGRRPQIPADLTQLNHQFSNPSRTSLSSPTRTCGSLCSVSILSS